MTTDVRHLRRALRARDADPGPRRARPRAGRAASADDSYWQELHELRTNYAGRPTPLTRAARFDPDRRVYLKREDLLHTGAHKLNNALGQAVLASAARQAADRRRDRRRPARRRDGDGLREVRPRLRRLHGRRGHAPPGAERRADAPARRRGARRSSSARKTLKEATSEAIRDWITNVETTHYLIGSCVGPAPYPELVRDLQRVIGDEAREQILAAGRPASRAVIACVGGGSNAIGIVLRLHRGRRTSA